MAKNLKNSMMNNTNLKKLDKMLEKLINDEMVSNVLIGFLIIYCILIAPNLPQKAANLFANIYFRVFVMVVISVVCLYDPVKALLMAIGFVLSIQRLYTLKKKNILDEKNRVSENNVPEGIDENISVEQPMELEQEESVNETVYEEPVVQETIVEETVEQPQMQENVLESVNQVEEASGPLELEGIPEEINNENREARENVERMNEAQQNMNNVNTNVNSNNNVKRPAIGTLLDDAGLNVEGFQDAPVQAEPVVEAEPVVDDKPVAEAKPATDAKPVINSNIVSDENMKLDIKTFKDQFATSVNNGYSHNSVYSSHVSN